MTPSEPIYTVSGMSELQNWSLTWDVPDGPSGSRFFWFMEEAVKRAHAIQRKYPAADVRLFRANWESYTFDPYTPPPPKEPKEPKLPKEKPLPAHCPRKPEIGTRYSPKGGQHPDHVIEVVGKANGEIKVHCLTDGQTWSF